MFMFDHPTLMKKTPFCRCPEVLPDDATDLIKRLLRRNPVSRLGAGPLTGDVAAAKPFASGTSETGDDAEHRGSQDDGSGEEAGGDAKERMDRGRRNGRVGGDGGGGGFEALKAHPFFRGLEFVGDGQVR